MVNQVLVDKKEIKVHLAHQALTVYQVFLDLLDLRVLQASPEKKVSVDYLVQVDNQAYQASQA